MARQPDHYAVLEVSPRARQAVIEAAYKRLVRDEHPDVNGGALVATERTQAITQAHAVLSDPLARARYDRERTDRLPPTRPPYSPKPLWPATLGLVFAIGFVVAFLPGIFVLRLWWTPLGAVIVSMICGYIAGAWAVGIILTGAALDSYVPGSNIAGWILGEHFPGPSATQRIRSARLWVRLLVATLRITVGLVIGLVATPFALIITWPMDTPPRRTADAVVYGDFSVAAPWWEPDVPVRDGGHPRLTGGGLEKR